MPSTATITGTNGPGISVTATAISNITSFTLDCENEVITFFTNDGKPPRAISVTTASTWTLTVSGNTYTLTVS